MESEQEPLLQTTCRDKKITRSSKNFLNISNDTDYYTIELLHELKSKNEPISIYNTNNNTKVFSLNLSALTMTSWDGEIIVKKIKINVRHGTIYFKGFIDDGFIGLRLSPTISNHKLCAEGCLYTTKYLFGLGIKDIANIYILK